MGSEGTLGIDPEPLPPSLLLSWLRWEDAGEAAPPTGAAGEAASTGAGEATEAASPAAGRGDL